MERLRRLSSPRWMSVYGWRLGAASVDVGILGSVYGRDWERLSSSGRYQSEAVVLIAHVEDGLKVLSGICICKVLGTVDLRS